MNWAQAVSLRQRGYNLKNCTCGWNWRVWETLKGAKTKEEFEQGLAQLKSELSAGKTFAVKK